MRHGGPNNNEFSQTLILVDYVPFSVAATELSSRKCLGRGYSRFSVYTSHKSLYQTLQPSWQWWTPGRLTFDFPQFLSC